MSLLDPLKTQLASGENPLSLPYLDLQISRADLGRLLARLVGEDRACHLAQEAALILRGGTVEFLPEPSGREGVHFEIDESALWDLLPPEADLFDRLAALIRLIGSARSELGLTVTPTPRGTAVQWADYIQLPARLLGRMLRALLPQNASLLLAYQETDQCWTMRLKGGRLRISSCPAVSGLDRQLRSLRIGHQVDLAIGCDSNGSWAVSTPLELEDLLTLIRKLPQQDGLRALLNQYRENARQFLGSQPLGILVDGLDEEPTLLEISSGALRLADHLEGTPVTLSLGVCRRLLDLTLFSGGRRLGDLLERLIPTGLRADRQEEQVMMLGRMTDQAGRPFELLISGGAHYPGGVLWEGDAFLAVTDGEGTTVQQKENTREPLRLAQRGAHLILRCPEWDSESITLDFEPVDSLPFSWGPGSLLAESNILSALLPGMRGAVRRGRLGQPRELNIGGQRFTLHSAWIGLVTATGIRYRGMLDLAETRTHLLVSNGNRSAWIEEIDCLPHGGGAPHWWTHLVRTSSMRRHRADEPAGQTPLTELFETPLMPPTATGPLSISLPDATSWRVLQVLATPFDSRGVFTIRLRAQLRNAGWSGLFVAEQTIDLRRLLPEPVWDDRVMRPHTRRTDDGLQVSYGGKTLLEFSFTGEIRGLPR